MYHFLISRHFPSKANGITGLLQAGLVAPSAEGQTLPVRKGKSLAIM